MCQSTKAKTLPDKPPAKTNPHSYSNHEVVFASLKPNLSMIRYNFNGEVNVVLNDLMCDTNLDE
jgi:hypothetical protein